MDLQISFPVSGVTSWFFFPPLVALRFVLASMGGFPERSPVPLQINYLHFVTPSVSAPILSITMWRSQSVVFAISGKVVWPDLAWILVLATCRIFLATICA